MKKCKKYRLTALLLIGLLILTGCGGSNRVAPAERLALYERSSMASLELMQTIPCNGYWYSLLCQWAQDTGSYFISASSDPEEFHYIYSRSEVDIQSIAVSGDYIAWVENDYNRELATYMLYELSTQTKITMLRAATGESVVVPHQIGFYGDAVVFFTGNQTGQYSLMTYSLSTGEIDFVFQSPLGYMVDHLFLASSKVVFSLSSDTDPPIVMVLDPRDLSTIRSWDLPEEVDFVLSAAYDETNQVVALHYYDETSIEKVGIFQPNGSEIRELARIGNGFVSSFFCQDGHLYMTTYGYGAGGFLSLFARGSDHTFIDYDYINNTVREVDAVYYATAAAGSVYGLAYESIDETVTALYRLF